MINVLFIDLDGTILETKERHYKCYRDIIKSNGKPLNKDIYWQLKRKRVGLDIILKMSKYKYDEKSFLKEWSTKIENINWLKYDRLKPDIGKTLRYFTENDFKVILVTMRQNKANLIEELTRFNIIECFDKIVCCELREGSKYDMVKNIKYDDAFFIGDTEEDINTAKLLNIKSIAILNGLREKKFLQEANYFFYEVKDITVNKLI